jgi:xanthine dehydrogenase YagR molybdenum-binding subunit
VPPEPPEGARLRLAYKDMTAPAGSPFQAAVQRRVLYSGQPVALVLAETFEAARRAAALVRIATRSSRTTPPLATWTRLHASRLKAGTNRRPPKRAMPTRR